MKHEKLSLEGIDSLAKTTRITLMLFLLSMTSILSAQITTYPYTMSFEASETIDWTTLAGLLGCTNEWYDTDISEVPSSGAEAAHDGSIYITTYYLLCQPVEKIVVGPTFDLTGLSGPTFSFFYHMYGSDMGTLDLDISTNGGSTWTVLLTPNLSGQQHTSNTDPWTQQVVDLSTYAGQSIQLRFRANGLGDKSSFCLDLFKVYDADDNTINGQGDVFYSYDEAGNRTGRQYFVSLVDDEELIAAVRSAVSQEAESMVSIDASLVNIYPNPVSNYINVELNQKAGVSNVYIFDMMGRQIEVHTMTGSYGQIDMSSYQEGSYVILIQSGGGEIVRKVVKQ